MIKPSLQKSDLHIQQTELVYDGFFKMKKIHLQHGLFAGGQTPTITRELFDRGEAVAVLLYDPILDSVVLTEQFRIGATDEASPWLFELVAGMIESGEQPQEVAKREALEEAGAVIEQLIPICDYLVSPGGTNEKLYVYLALVDSTQLQGIHGLADESEDILLHTFNRETAYQAVQSGQINNAATIIALQWLQLNVNQYRKN